MREEARDWAFRYLSEKWESIDNHYHFSDGHLSEVKGYESYGQMQQLVNAPGGVDAMVEFFLGLQIWGTPKQCVEKIVDCTNRCGADSFVGIFSYADMPYDYAEKNMRLFASDVMPKLKSYSRRKLAAE